MPVSLDTLAEEPHVGRVERLAAPLARVLGEDLERLAAVHHRAIDGLRDAAGHGHVCADSKHPITIMTACEQHSS